MAGRTVIIEKNHIYRDSLKTVLKQIDGISIILESPSYQMFKDYPGNNNIDIIFLDYDEIMANSPELPNYLKSNFPSAQVVSLTNQNEFIDQPKIYDNHISKNAPKQAFKNLISKYLIT